MTTTLPKKPAKKKARTLASSRRGIRLNETEKTEAIALWEAGSVTLDELAVRFGRHRSTFIRLFNEREVIKGSAAAAHSKKVAEAVQESLLGEAAQMAQRIRDTKEDHYKMASGLAKLMWNSLAKAKQENRSIGTTALDMKALQAAAQVLKTTREERYAVLGLNEKEQGDDGDLPDLIVQELTADQIKQMHQQQGEIKEDDIGDFDMEVGTLPATPETLV